MNLKFYKIYIWFLLCFTAANFWGYVPSLEPFELVNHAVLLFSFIAFGGFAYNRKVLIKQFWYIFVFIFFSLEIFNNLSFFEGQWQINLGILILTLPKYLAVGMYPYLTFENDLSKREDKTSKIAKYVDNFLTPVIVLHVLFSAAGILSLSVLAVYLLLVKHNIFSILVMGMAACFVLPMLKYKKWGFGYVWFIHIFVIALSGYVLLNVYIRGMIDVPWIKSKISIQQGLYQHSATSFQFSEKVENFRREKVKFLNKEGTEVKVFYRTDGDKAPVAVSVHIYPVLETMPVGNSAELELSMLYLDEVNEDIVMYNSGNKLRGKLTTFDSVEFFNFKVNQKTRYRSYVFSSRKWFINYKFQYLQADEIAVGKLIFHFMEKLKWPPMLLTGQN